MTTTIKTAQGSSPVTKLREAMDKVDEAMNERVPSTSQTSAVKNATRDGFTTKELRQLKDLVSTHAAAIDIEQVVELIEDMETMHFEILIRSR